MEAMIYSVSVLDLCDFESIGRKMPKGQGIAGTVNNGALAPKHTTKKRSKSKGERQAAKQQKCIVSEIEKADEKESKMAALRLFLEFGSPEEKQKAKDELATIAFPTKSKDTSSNTDIDEDDDSTTSSVELVA